jgi:hypothetical protein
MKWLSQERYAFRGNKNKEQGKQQTRREAKESFDQAFDQLQVGHSPGFLKNIEHDEGRD